MDKNKKNKVAITKAIAAAGIGAASAIGGVAAFTHEAEGTEKAVSSNVDGFYLKSTKKSGSQLSFGSLTKDQLLKIMATIFPDGILPETMKEVVHSFDIPSSTSTEKTPTHEAVTPSVNHQKTITPKENPISAAKENSNPLPTGQVQTSGHEQAIAGSSQNNIIAQKGNSNPLPSGHDQIPSSTNHQDIINQIPAPKGINPLSPDQTLTPTHEAVTPSVNHQGTITPKENPIPVTKGNSNPLPTGQVQTSAHEQVIHNANHQDGILPKENPIPTTEKKNHSSSAQTQLSGFEQIINAANNNNINAQKGNPTSNIDEQIAAGLMSGKSGDILSGKTSSSIGNGKEVPKNEGIPSGADEFNEKTIVDSLKITTNGVFTEAMIKGALDNAKNKLMHDPKMVENIKNIGKKGYDVATIEKQIKDKVKTMVEETLKKGVMGRIESSFSNTHTDDLIKKLENDGFDTSVLKKMSQDNMNKYNEILKKLASTDDVDVKARLLNELNDFSSSVLDESKINKLILDGIVPKIHNLKVNEKIGLIIAASVSSIIGLVFGSIAMKTMRRQDNKFASIKSKKMLIIISLSVILLMAAAAAGSISYLFIVGGIL